MISDVETIGQEPNDALLRAQFACQRLVIEAARLADDGRASEIFALFAEKGEHRLGGKVISGVTLKQFLEEREAMRDRRTRHCISNMAFKLLAADRARMISTCVVYVVSHDVEDQGRIPETIIDFIDDFARDERGVWRFTCRDVRIQAGSRG